MDGKELKRLLDIYKDGTITPEEKQLLEEWFDGLSSTGSYDLSEDEEYRIEQSLRDRVDRGMERRSWKVFQPLKIAACLFLVLSMTLLYFHRQRIESWGNPVKYVVSSVPVTKQLRLTLSDGSKVMLNSGSKIRYPVKFAREVREVFLEEGEAYFEIEHDVEKPFVVVSSGIRTEVLGTAFNVWSYQSSNEIEVAVTRGKVAVSDFVNKRVFLEPDEQITINKSSGKAEKQTIKASDEIAWTEGKLSFDNEALSHVAMILQNAYDVEISFRQVEIKAIRFTASFVRGDPLDDIIYAIAKANKLEYRYTNKRIEFRVKNINI